MTRRGAILGVLAAALIGGIFVARDYFKYTRFSHSLHLMKFFAGDGFFSDPSLTIGKLHGMAIGQEASDVQIVQWICFSDTPVVSFRFAALATDAVPPPGPIWLGCYDADRIAADLKDGTAKAYALQTFTDSNLLYIAAVYADGQGAMWRQKLTVPLLRPKVQP